MEGIICQLWEGATGDLTLAAGKTKPRLSIEAEQRGNLFHYKPGAPAVVREGESKVCWSGRDPAWKDVKGFRGKDDVEKPVRGMEYHRMPLRRRQGRNLHPQR